MTAYTVKWHYRGQDIAHFDVIVMRAADASDPSIAARLGQRKGRTTDIVLDWVSEVSS